MSAKTESLWKKYNTWLKYNFYQERDLKKEALFLKKAYLEQLHIMANLTQDVRRLEGRKGASLDYTPGIEGVSK